MSSRFEAAEVEESEIDLGVVFRILNLHKISIIAIVIVFTLVAAVKVYFKPDIYSTSTIVEIGIETRNSPNDLIAQATEGSALTTDTEIGIIKSRYLAKYALEKVDFTHRYYMKKNLKEIELYKDSPFDVNLTKGKGLSFLVYPIDKTLYRLEIKRGQWSYDKIHDYSKEVSTDHFSFVLNKKDGQELTEKVYRFIVLNEQASVGYVVGNTSVSQQNKHSALLKISYRDVVPLRAKEYVDALAESYIEQSVHRKTREASKTLNFVDDQLLKINDNLKHSAVQLENFKVKTNAISLDEKAKNVVKRIGEFKTTLMELEMQETLLTQLYKKIKTGKNLEKLTMAGFGEKEGEDSSLSSLVATLQDNLLKVKLLRSDYTEAYPEIKKLRRQIKATKRIIIETAKNMRKNISNRIKLIKISISNQEKLLKKFPEDEREYGRLQRTFVINEKIYSYLLEQRSATAITKASTVSKNRVLDKALYPGGPVSPDRKRSILIGLILGLVFGVGYAFLRAFLDDRIKNEEDISRGTDAGILGSLPDMGKEYSRGGKLYIFKAPKSIIAEAYRNIRTNLRFLSPTNGSQIIVVTSTVSGEGKTTICANLAGIMSMSNKRVVVVNLDMRKPTLHQEFDLHNNDGISTVLSNNALLPDVIQHTKYEKLDLISSGPIPPNPSELIESGRMYDILNKLRSVYDVIILDTPPIGIVSDSRTLMGVADSTIYVIRADYAKKEFLKKVNSIYKSKDIKSFGIILNGTDIKKRAYGYGYEYEYGYGTDYYDEKTK